MSGVGAREEEPEEREREEEARGEIGPGEAAFGNGRPDPEGRADRKDEGEEREPGESGGAEADQRAGAHSFRPHRAFTNTMTASARFFGMSRGFSMRSVRPVAR